MSNSKMFDDLSRKFSELLAQSPLQDIEKNSRALLGQMFSKLDLISREEFDVQAQLLLNTREKLATLEARLGELEGKPEPGITGHQNV